MSNEARVLRHLRESTGLSMREAASKMGVSGSLVSQIENGREDPPKEERLQRFLDTYCVTLKAYKRMAKSWQEEQLDIDVITNLLPRLKGRDHKTIRVLVEHLINEK